MTEELDSASLEEAQKRIGTTLRGKWHLERLIGIGGMGAVYEGRHRNGMRGAVKVLDLALARTKDCRERFLREGRLANEVAHDGAVRVLDDDETGDGSAFLVMELLTGSTLDVLAMRRGGTLTADEIARYSSQVLDTLIAAHARGIVHRDIKPENLFLTNEGAMKVLDFGIARMTGLSESQRVTHAGEPIGTPAFMSPEQARGHWHEVDARSDIYSLGATMFTLATGSMVHAEATVADLLVAVITRPARPVRQLADVPSPLAAIIDKALCHAKEGRFESADEMRVALELAYREMTGAQIPATPRTPGNVPLDEPEPSSGSLRAHVAATLEAQKRRPWMVALAIPATAAAICGVIASTSSHSHAAVAMVPSYVKPAVTLPIQEALTDPSAIARDAVAEADEAPQPETKAPQFTRAHSPVNAQTQARRSEEVSHPPNASSWLSRHSPVYERRY